MPSVSADDPRQSLQRKTDEFLREFFEKGEMLVKELINENDRLRSQLETRPMLSQAEAAKPVTRDNMVDLLMLRISALEHECDEIRSIAGSVEEESGGFRHRLDSLEAEHYHLASMFVAGSQFHSATSFDEVLRTITEILLNFVGAGSFTVYLVDEERQVLFPVAREGGSVEEVSEIALHGDAAGPAQAAIVALGRAWKSGDPEFQIGPRADQPSARERDPPRRRRLRSSLSSNKSTDSPTTTISCSDSSPNTPGSGSRTPGSGPTHKTSRCNGRRSNTW